MDHRVPLPIHDLLIYWLPPIENGADGLASREISAS
jgi:hypothetical protein